MTYPDEQVAGMLNRDFIPVQVDIEKASVLSDRFQALWTPNLNVVNGDGKRVYHVVGWLPPSEMAAMLETARGHYFLNKKQFEVAAPLFKGVFERFGRSAFAPEALYYRGVCRYLSSHEVDKLKEDWDRLQRFYPGSSWAMKSNII